jgi:STAM-binding protein
MRYATLVAEKLPLHPGVKASDERRVLKAATRTIPNVIARLEALKPRIEARYGQWQTILANRREVIVSSHGEDSRQSSLSLDLAESDPAIAGNSATLAAAEHGELAVKLAHKEIRRRDAARKATRRAGISEEEEHERRTAGLWDDWEKELGETFDDDDAQCRMTEVRRKMDQPHDIVPDGARKKPTKVSRPSIQHLSQQRSNSSYRYPSVSKPQPLPFEEWQPDFRPSLGSAFLPPVPSKEGLYSVDLYDGAIPPRPGKEAVYESPSPTPSPIEETPAFTFRPSAYLENGSPLRTVFLPPTLRERFLSIAAPNTRANLETCGILCGTLISNALFISRLVIPEQESTSDTCETVNESALFDFCDSEDLMVLGWIHTHPTQTCFMSSRDLHTHCGYQVMMPESIAIVCAPSKSPS